MNYSLYNKGRSSKVPKFDKHLKKARGTYRPKRCGNNNKDEDNSPKTLNEENKQASSQKFRQLIENYIYHSVSKLLIRTFFRVVSVL